MARYLEKSEGGAPMCQFALKFSNLESVYASSTNIQDSLQSEVVPRGPTNFKNPDPVLNSFQQGNDTLYKWQLKMGAIFHLQN